MATTNNASQIIKFTTITGDFLIVNILFLLFYHFSPDFIWKSAELLEKCLTVLNISYSLFIYNFKIQLHKRIVSPETIIGRVVIGITLFIIIFICLLGLLRLAVPRSILPGFYLSILFSVSCWRIIMRKVVKDFRKKGRNTISCIIVGNQKNAAELYEKLSGDPSSGYIIRGVFSDSPLTEYPKEAQLLGKVSELIPYLKSNPVNAVFCTLPSAREQEIVELINYCENNMTHFFSVPNVRNYLHRRMRMRLIDDIPVLYIRDEPLQKLSNKILKRSFDFIASTIFLCTIYPFIYLIVGIIIKLTSPGPIYFKQERSGEQGKVFKCIKFRSMKVNKDSDTVQATENDPRKTKFGNFLRKSNIDELPQFINVWKGEMSIVGPRPHMLKHTEMYSQLINKYMVRHLAKPGITGWAQVTGFRGETKELSQMEGRVKRDIWYIENWTPLLDLRIIYKTIANVIKGDKQAY